MRNGGDSMIKTAFYDTKEYDKPSFEKYGQPSDRFCGREQHDANRRKNKKAQKTSRFRPFLG